MNKETELALKLLAAATDRLIRLCNLEESRVPTGFMPLLRTVTTQTLKLELVPPWIAFTMINDGPGEVSVWTNDKGEPTAINMIAVGQTYNCDMTYPVIRTLHLKSASTSAVRIFGIEGRAMV